MANWSLAAAAAVTPLAVSRIDSDTWSTKPTACEAAPAIALEVSCSWREADETFPTTSPIPPSKPPDSRWIRV
jgi:hypothetical protein